MAVHPTHQSTEPSTTPAVGGRADVIVVGLDASAWSRAAADWAAAEAVLRHAGLVLVHAYAVTDPAVYAGAIPALGYPGYLPDPEGLDQELHDEGERLLAGVADSLGRAHPALRVTTLLVQDDAISAIRRESEHALLTVVGSHGSGRVASVFLGSVALSVSTHNSAPVAVIHPDHHIGGPGPVVVGVDNSPNSEPAVAFAFDAASVHEAELVAVHTFTDTVADGGTQEEHAMLSEQLAGWREKYPEVTVRQVVVHGRPAPILLEHTHDAQLIVVGSRGRHGLASFVLGSTSRALIAHSECPVVVVRPNMTG